MGTGVTPKRIATKNSLLSYLAYCPLMRYTSSALCLGKLSQAGLLVFLASFRRIRSLIAKQ